MATFVLVHGGFHGGWVYGQVAKLLRGLGHDVHTPTLTGLGDRSHLADFPINLDTHIKDVVNLLDWEELSDVVLLGHSYGGMVVTGAADRRPEKIHSLVYLDALVPKDGETLFTLRPEYLDYFLGQVSLGGGSMVPSATATEFDAVTSSGRAILDAKSTAHPFACFTQKIELSGAVDQVSRRYYIYVENGICEEMYKPFRSMPTAKVIPLGDCGHSIMVDVPKALTAILVESASA